MPTPSASLTVIFTFAPALTVLPLSQLLPLLLYLTVSPNVALSLTLILNLALTPPHSNDNSYSSPWCKPYADCQVKLEDWEFGIEDWELAYSHSCSTLTFIIILTS